MDLEVVRAQEQTLATERLPQDDCRREDIDARIDVLTLELLGWHVRELSLDETAARLVLLGGDLRHAEVEHLARAIDGDEQIAGRDVAVHDRCGAALRVAQLVSVVEAITGLAKFRKSVIILDRACDSL